MNPNAPDLVRRLIGLYGDSYHEWLRERWRARMEGSGSLLIFGAGQNGRFVLKHLRSAGLEPAAFVDETPDKLGQHIEGLPVISLDEAATRADPLAIVSLFTPAHDYLTVSARLRAAGIDTAPLFAALWTLDADSMPFYFLAPPKVILEAENELTWLASRLLDTTSADVLLAHLEFRLALRFEALPMWNPRRLRAPAGSRRLGLVDAGAFDGDTLLPMLANEGDRIAFAVGLEPDAKNFAALSAKLRDAHPHRPEIRAIEAAVDEISRRRGFASLGHTGSGFDTDGAEVETLALDDLLTETPPDVDLYIKLDVEGAEAAALQGARRTIAERLPFLSMAVYHHPADLWRLPQMVHAIQEDYCFRLRSHGADGADLMIYAERAR